MSSIYERECEVAALAVRRAAAVCRSIQAKISAEALEKRDHSPVTVADYSSQALICSTLLEAFPGDPVIAEEDAGELRKPENEAFLESVCHELESLGVREREQVLGWIDHGRAQSYSDRFWTLDPVDGTKGFLRGEHYAVALALVVQGQPVVAALACPGLPSADGLVGTLFTAVRGHGSIAAPLWLDEQGKSICVSPVYATAKMRMCESVESAHSAHGASADVRKRLGITTDAVRLDSQAKYGVVARGEAEIYLRLPTRQDYREKIWDHAAGALIVEEAGGRVSDVSGAPLDFTRGRELRSNRGVVVTNGPGHDEILRVLVELGVS